ncbi:putative inhibitor of apoptosis isoform X2 [Planococcus citri]|uniref:putative inhibitor of apoptosis isoform X2 n=1 Tax=Planococcus citri TaxID=170843 RepID=UPI0031F9BE34
MNLRSRHMLDVEEIHNRLKSNHHSERKSKVRKKMKNIDSVGVLLHRIHAANDGVYEAAEDLVTSRRKYHEIKTKLRNIIAEKDQIREDICQRRDNLQRVTSELHKAVSELKTRDISDLSEKEAVIVQLNSWLVEEDVIEAWKHIGYAEEDLKENSCEMKGSKRNIRSLNSVSLPNVFSNSTISVIGSINISRNKCCICLEQRVNAVLYKCGHTCMCFDCATKLMDTKKCPVCRSEIIDVIKTYLA